jgi:hypothetical protein
MIFLYKLMNNREVIFENNESFQCILIKPFDISILNWKDPDYAGKISTLPCYELFNTNKDNFNQDIFHYLNTTDNNKLYLKNIIIHEELDYVYELLFIENNTDKNVNEIGNMLINEEEKIYGNAILLKNHIPHDNLSMSLVSVYNNDIKNILYDRAFPKHVIYSDDHFYEDKINDFDKYVENFFDSNSFNKYECGFLSHNLNIWYTSEYGDDNICGKLINKPIEKCIIFSMKNENYKCSISLNEIKKIIHLSNKLYKYITPDEYIKDSFDKLGRKIIYNKYRILYNMFNKYK